MRSQTAAPGLLEDGGGGAGAGRARGRDAAWGGWVLRVLGGRGLGDAPGDSRGEGADVVERRAGGRRVRGR